jgi:glycosyltransferase involved in cell wall biosynthesis
MRRVLYLQYTNPAAYPPLEHSSRILADAGWDVLFLGTSGWGTAAFCFPPHPRITVRLMPFCEAGWRQKVHYLRFCVWALWRVLCWRPQWVYASDPFSCLPAILLQTLLRVKLLYHEHDSPGRSMGENIFLRVSTWARAMCARQASLCILPNQRRADLFAADTGRSGRVAVVWNCPAREEVGPPRAPGAGTELKIMYHGSIVPDRLPLAVVDALRAGPEDVSLTIAGYETVGSAGYVDRLRSHAEKLGVGRRVHYAGAIANRQDLLEICRGSDVGLSLLPLEMDDGNLQTLTGASNKPFDYLASGLAMVVSDLPDWQEMFVRPGYALACNPADGDSIAAAIRRFREDPAGMRAMGEKGRRRILAEWNYERQFQPILQVMSEGAQG